MKYLAWSMALALSFVFISPFVVFGQCASVNDPDVCGATSGCLWDFNDNRCITVGGSPTGGSAPGQPIGGSECPPGRICNPLRGSNTFAQLMAKIAQAVAQIALPIVVIFIIYAGFLFVSARGNEEQLQKAKTTFFWAVIGALLVLGAGAIAIAIENFAKQL